MKKTVIAVFLLLSAAVAAQPWTAPGYNYGDAPFRLGTLRCLHYTSHDLGLDCLRT